MLYTTREDIVNLNDKVKEYNYYLKGTQGFDGPDVKVPVTTLLFAISIEDPLYGLTETIEILSKATYPRDSAQAVLVAFEQYCIDSIPNKSHLTKQISDTRIEQWWFDDENLKESVLSARALFSKVGEQCERAADKLEAAFRCAVSSGDRRQIISTRRAYFKTQADHYASCAMTNMLGRNYIQYRLVPYIAARTHAECALLSKLELLGNFDGELRTLRLSYKYQSIKRKIVREYLCKLHELIAEATIEKSTQE